jgi:hypothetical protein
LGLRIHSGPCPNSTWAPLIQSEQIGNDFLAFWTAGTLLARAESPYHADGQTRIQKELGWDREKNGLGIYEFLPYYYPPWLGLAFVPLLPLGYGIAKPVWCFLNLELAVAAGFLLGCPRSGPSRGAAVVLTLTFFPTLVCLLSAQTSVLILLLAVAVWRLSERGWDGAAGIALACLSVKPQLSVVAMFAVLVWAIRQRRRRLLFAFLATCLGLVAVSQAIVPSWLGDMLAAPRLTPPPTDYFPWIGTTWLLLLRTAGLEGTLRKVISFLGVQGTVPPPPLKKQADSQTEAWVEEFANYFRRQRAIGWAVRLVSRRW